MLDDFSDDVTANECLPLIVVHTSATQVNEWVVFNESLAKSVLEEMLCEFHMPCNSCF